MTGLRFAVRWTTYTITVGVTLALIGVAWIIWDQDHSKNRHA